MTYEPACQSKTRPGSNGGWKFPLDVGQIAVNLAVPQAAHPQW